MKLAAAFTLLVILTLVGCANSASLAVEDRSRTLTESKEGVYNAALAYLGRNGFEIAQASPETGTIITEYKRGSGLYTFGRDRHLCLHQRA